MLSLFKRLINRKSYPLNRILVSKEQLLKNYRYLSGLSNSIKIAPVLKSNGYGHGIELVGRILDSEKAPFFCVDSLYEAYILQKSKVKTPILVMGYIDPQSLKRKKLSLDFAVFSLDYVEALDKYQPGCNVHIFVDTGMHREGVRVEDLKGFLEKLKEFKNINIVGLMTHLAMADKPNDPLTKSQLENFKKAKHIASDQNLGIKWFHIGGGVSVFKVKNPPANLIRTGKVLYGVGPDLEPTPIKPIAKMITKIVQLKQISKGEKVGYDFTFTANQDITIGILPIGYNDGVDRRLSSKGLVIVDGVDCPIIGRISMNITAIDISNVKEPFVGQEVLVFSDNPQAKNSILNAAKLAGTIPYDLMVHLAASTKRIII